MKTPREIYLTFTHNGHIVESDQPIPGNNSIKYTRADIAELTWEDMKQIDLCFHEVATEQTIGKLKLHSFQEMYEEVLRRFLESKRR